MRLRRADQRVDHATRQLRQARTRHQFQPVEHQVGAIQRKEPAVFIAYIVVFKLGLIIAALYRRAVLHAGRIERYAARFGFAMYLGEMEDQTGLHALFITARTAGQCEHGDEHHEIAATALKSHKPPQPVK